MKLFRTLAAIAAVLFVGRRLMHRVMGEFVGMAHPGGFLTRARVQPGYAGGALDRYDASDAVDASWVDEQAIAGAAVVAGDQTPADRSTH